MVTAAALSFSPVTVHSVGPRLCHCGGRNLCPHAGSIMWWFVALCTLPYATVLIATTLSLESTTRDLASLEAVDKQELSSTAEKGAGVQKCGFFHQDDIRVERDQAAGQDIVSYVDIMNRGTNSIDAVSPNNSSADLQKLEDPEAVSMAQLIDCHIVDSILEYHVEIANFRCPAGSNMLDYSRVGMGVVAYIEDLASNGDLVLPLNAIREGVEHLGTSAQKNQTLNGSSFQGVVVDHHGGDHESCSSIGILSHNIDKL
ncbi:hypothetical protein Nepgr_018821 [Nepenthes gracilis]|uniref:Uncharacterized protein n=1 Tax=Nepenthes gracilis TaxID=150966 RepID=A0AAD3XUM4_NEPGR|nr:hypothetical protein Nepgr_018821 [Nepenthes gracilis]